MDIQPQFGPDQLLAHIAGDIANAVSERAGESPGMRLVRAQAADLTMRAFAPRDGVEAMFAGHCVLFHELIVDSVHGSLRGEADASRRAERSSIVAMDRAFGNNLTRLERYRNRLAKEAGAGESRAETRIADRVWAGTATRVRAEPGSAAAGDGVLVSEAAAGPGACDSGQAAQTAGTDQLGEDWQAAAAAQMAGLNRQARRELSRKMRKRVGPAIERLARAGGMTNAGGSTEKGSVTATG